MGIKPISDEALVELESYVNRLTIGMGDHVPHLMLGEVLSLIARLREAEKDAVRYRVLVESGQFCPAHDGLWSLSLSRFKSTKRELDQVLDTFIEKSKCKQ